MTVETPFGTWRWCPGFTGRCARCGTMIEGMWRHFVRPAESNCDCCPGCAGISEEDS